jgi:hypothetical protein
MFDELLSPAFLPFAAAAATVVVIAVIEVVAMLLGLAISDALDNLLPDIDLDHGDAGGMLAWLGFGKVPFLVALIVILGSFAIFGIALQHSINSLFGTPLWPPLAVIICGVLTLPTASWLSGTIGRLIPASESDGIHRDSLVGCQGEVVQGEASEARNAEAKILGPKGLNHWVRVRAERGETLPQGTSIRLISRESRTVFVARRITAPDQQP